MNFVLPLFTSLLIFLFTLTFNMFFYLLKLAIKAIINYIIPFIYVFFFGIYTGIVLLLRKLPFYDKLISFRNFTLKYGWLMVKDLWIVVLPVAFYSFYQ
ncbi:hypothetical protein [Campylobacter fetus]|uniref:hypothetical protein n=1 Tax=Campylobacter fetus TaxID=196 RepID=UPI0008189098|nr:hypothetical protein [Campylobacter fetus]OCR84537.1 hypothetical protein CFT12S05168_09205 [Campylobacter fetus subsp. testudinum]OCR95648.1 hypothetical protein CFT12S02847_07495 [Campylobacter fetus subsp. testudinum]